MEERWGVGRFDEGRGVELPVAGNPEPVVGGHQLAGQVGGLVGQVRHTGIEVPV